MSAWNSRYLSIDGGKQDVADSGAIGGYLGAATGQAGIARVIETGSRQCRLCGQHFAETADSSGSASDSRVSDLTAGKLTPKLSDRRADARDRQ
jgi:hypothetical protein